MEKIITFIVVFFFFIILSPGIFIKIPYKNSKLLVVTIHSVIFASFVCVIQHFMVVFTDNYESMTSSSVQHASCPAGQNWISGTNPRHGYCSTSTITDILSEDSHSQAQAQAPAPIKKTCPSGQNWISGTNPKHGYCSLSTVKDILFNVHPQSGVQSVDAVPMNDPSMNNKEIVKVPTTTSCPSGQNWISGTNQKYGYCSPSSTSEILSQVSPSTSSIYGIHPIMISK